MAVPAFIRHARVIMTLVAELRLILVTVHAGAIKAHDVLFVIIGNVGLPRIANDRVSPIFEQRFMIDANNFFGLDTFLFVGRHLRLGDVTHFSTCHIMPDGIGD